MAGLGARRKWLPREEVKSVKPGGDNGTSANHRPIRLSALSTVGIRLGLLRCHFIVGLAIHSAIMMIVDSRRAPGREVVYAVKIKCFVTLKLVGTELPPSLRRRNLNFA